MGYIIITSQLRHRHKHEYNITCQATEASKGVSRSINVGRAASNEPQFVSEENRYHGAGIMMHAVEYKENVLISGEVKDFRV